jgi:hypothetical protein
MCPERLGCLRNVSSPISPDRTDRGVGDDSPPRFLPSAPNWTEVEKMSAGRRACALSQRSARQASTRRLSEGQPPVKAPLVIPRGCASCHAIIVRRLTMVSHDETAGHSVKIRGLTRGWAARGATHGCGPAMDHVTHLGLDVHKDTIAVAILRPDLPSPPALLVVWPALLDVPVRARCGATLRQGGLVGRRRAAPDPRPVGHAHPGRPAASPTPRASFTVDTDG